MRRTLALPYLVLALLVPAGATVPALADCKAKLKELDALLEAGTELDEARLRVIRGLRDTAAMQCEQGKSVLAEQILQGTIEQLQESASEAQARENAPEGLPKARLDGEYLEGHWCTSWEKSPERVLYRFERDGTYRIGMLAGKKHALQLERYSLKHFHGRFDKLISVGKNRFVVENEHGHRIIYDRGRCSGDAS